MVDDDMKLCRLVRDYLEPWGTAFPLRIPAPDGLEMALAGISTP